MTNRTGDAQLQKKSRLSTIRTALMTVALALYPMLGANQGIDLSDPLYSLTNFRFFQEMGGAWSLATYLANVVGSVLIRLPFGRTLLGMNLATRGVISLTAIAAFLMLRKKFPEWTVFVGELIAIGFCWCPSTILYNYLTYFLFVLVCLFLWQGLAQDAPRLLFAAGVMLGLNVMVRTPNIAEALLILAVFFWGLINHQKAAKQWQNVGLCVGGFLTGYLVVLLVICIRYGFSEYLGMFSALAGYGDTDATYSGLSMLTAVPKAYLSTLVWALLLVLYGAAGIVAFRLTEKRKVLCRIVQVSYVLGALVVLRLFWGRGMFTFTYYNYRSIYQWGMLLLYLAWGFGLWAVADRKRDPKDRVFACILLLSLVVLPLGSNNEAMPILNSLFLAAPFVTAEVLRLLLLKTEIKRADTAAAMALPMLLILVMCLVQGSLFHVNFAFGDGIYGEKRSAKAQNSAILADMETRPENARLLGELLAYCEGCEEPELITLGSAPGLHYLLDKAPAISHAWPDLGTYPTALWEEELNNIAHPEEILVIRFVWEGQASHNADKEQILDRYLEEHHYTMTFSNEGYQVYRYDQF